MVDKELEGLIDKYTDYMECDEYHIHGDSTEEYEEYPGTTPLPHNFSFTELHEAIKALIYKAENLPLQAAQQQDKS